MLADPTCPTCIAWDDGDAALPTHGRRTRKGDLPDWRPGSHRDRLSARAADLTRRGLVFRAVAHARTL